MGRWHWNVETRRLLKEQRGDELQGKSPEVRQIFNEWENSLKELR